jgi:hypothetical protein
MFDGLICKMDVSKRRLLRTFFEMEPFSEFDEEE